MSAPPTHVGTDAARLLTGAYRMQPSRSTKTATRKAAKPRRASGQIVPKGDRKFLVRCFIGRDPLTGKRQYGSATVTGTTRDAQKELARLQGEVQTGAYRARARKTLGAYLSDEWIAERAADMRRGELSPRALEDYKRAVAKLVLHFGGLQLDGIPRAQAAEVRRMIGDRYKPAAAQRTFDVLKMAMNRALELDLIAVNPFAAEKRLKVAAPKTAALTAQEIGRFLQAAEDYRYGKDSALFHVLLLAGLRPGEALALRWDDLQGNALRVERAVTDDAEGHSVVGRTKTRTTRFVSLPASAVEALTAHYQRQLAGVMRGGARRTWEANGRLMFPNEAGQIRSIDSVRNAWGRILAKAGLPTVRLYDARHSYVTTLLHAGVDVKTVSQLAGHKNPAMTLQRYAHATVASQEDAAERLQAAVTTVTAIRRMA